VNILYVIKSKSSVGFAVSMNLARLDLFVGETFSVYTFCLNAGRDIHECHVFLLDSLLKSISLST